MSSLLRRSLAEGLGTLLLLATVVGSGIMAARLAGGNDALALLANSLATGCGLTVFILAFGPISGAHFNPVVSLVQALRRQIPWRDAAAYVSAQVVGAYAGVATAHAMFDLPLFTASTHPRSSTGLWLSEGVATFGLLIVIVLCSASSSRTTTAAAVGAYITAAYWFTSSTSFANPAVAIARAATDTFAGIRPDHVAAFVVAEIVGAVAAIATLAALLPSAAPSAPLVVPPAQATDARGL